MGDTDVDFFQETLKQLITSSKVRSIMREKHQLESLEEKIKYMRVFLKVTEKKRNEHSKVMNLVRQIKDVVSEAENVVELFVVQSFKAKLAPYFLRQHPDDISLDLESVKKNIKTLTAEIKQIFDENMYDINGVASKKFEHSFLKSEGIGTFFSLAQVLSNPEDEAVQELITLLRRVVAPPSVIGVDANGVVHEQVNHDDVPRQAPQVYSNPTFESSMNMHNQPFVGPTALRSTVRPTSFYQNVSSVYEVGNSNGYGQNVNFNHGQSPQNGFTGNHAVNNGPYAYSMAPNVPSNGNYVNQTAQTLPNNGNNNGSYVQVIPNVEELVLEEAWDQEVEVPMDMGRISPEW
ncbi:hypothetical protein RHGRI_004010 [Rhododendron griersonianum]|uniref:Disease resistance N-terminal domain-containing protein n=1 Tax=Rhododendron griersonianum TaxID=479676 RepID=A0AAV6L7V5_9ERIC|nr:hypothetical protein RHGRI_004010 [Rhododendron griersonianum]